MSTKKETLHLLVELGEWLIILGALTSEIWLLGLNQSMITLVASTALLLAVGAYGFYAIITERNT